MPAARLLKVWGQFRASNEEKWKNVSYIFGPLGASDYKLQYPTFLNKVQ